MSQIALIITVIKCYSIWQWNNGTAHANPVCMYVCVSNRNLTFIILKLFLFVNLKKNENQKRESTRFLQSRNEINF